MTMSEIKAVLKGFLKTLILLVKPIGLLAKYLYRGIKAVVKPMVQATIYVFKQLWLAIRWLSMIFYKIIIKPIYIVLKKIVLGLQYAIKQVSICVYRYLLKPSWWVIQKLSIGFWWVIQQTSMLLWQYVLKYVYLLFKHIFMAIRYLFKLLWKGIAIFGHWLKAAFIVLKKIAITILKFIQPFFTWMYHRLLDILQAIQWVFTKLWVGLVFIVKHLYNAIEWLFVGIYHAFKWVIIQLIRGFQWVMDGLVYLYRNRPEWLYRVLRFTTIQTILFIYTIFVWLPKAILVDGLVYILKWLYRILKTVIYLVSDVLQKLFVICVNGLVSIKHLMNPLKRVLLDLVFDFKDYYYVILLLPILLPIFLLFGLVVFIEVIFMHIGLGFKALFHMDSSIIKRGYLPTINIFKFGKSWTQRLKLSLGYQQKWRNAHTLMILFLWPLMFPIRIVLCISLLPWTVLVGLFYGLQYIRYRDQIEFVIDDFIRIPNEVLGTIDGSRVKRFGHQLCIHTQNGVFDNELQTWAIDPLVETFRIDVEIDGQRYQSYTIKNKPILKTTLLYHMNQIQTQLRNHKTNRVPLPAIEGIEIEYQLTHQGDALYADEIAIRPFSNGTELLVKIKKDTLVYERELIVTTIHTGDLERLLLQSVFYAYQGQSVVSCLDSKHTYEVLPNPNTKGPYIDAKEMNFKVPFKVVGLDTVFEIPIQLIPTPGSILIFDRAIQTPVLDKRTNRYVLPEWVTLHGLIHQLEWFVDGESVSQIVSLDELSISKTHPFYVKVFDQYQTHQKTFHCLDPRYKTAWWDIEFDIICSTLLEEGPKKHHHLPMFGLKGIKCLYWVSTNPKQMKSTGLVKQPGVTRFKVVLYQRLFNRKVVFIDIHH
jgi:hypothetical protein